MPTQKQVLGMLNAGSKLEDIVRDTKSTKGAVKIHIQRLEQKGLWKRPVPEAAVETPPTTPTQPTATEKPEETKVYPITFESADAVVRFLVDKLQDPIRSGELVKTIAQKDSEIVRLADKLRDAQDKLARLESGIAALRVP
jgi:NH3-dependent NAD+ synthetase